MADVDPLDVELRTLADEAEHWAGTPPSAAEVRRRGARRRQNRAVAFAVSVVAALALTGGAVYSATLLGSGRPPVPAHAPTLAPTPPESATPTPVTVTASAEPIPSEHPTDMPSRRPRTRQGSVPTWTAPRPGSSPSATEPGATAEPTSDPTASESPTDPPSDPPSDEPTTTDPGDPTTTGAPPPKPTHAPTEGAPEASAEATS